MYRKVPKKKLNLGKVTKWDFVKKKAANRNDDVDEVLELQTFTSPARNLRTWKAELWANAPLKAESLLAQEAHIRQIEDNIKFLLRINQIRRYTFVLWMRQNRVTASRYLFKKRNNAFLPFVTLVDMIMISRFFNVSVDKLFFSNLEAGFNDSQN